MTHDQKLIQEGINYLRSMQNGQTVQELSENIGISEERIKEAIKAARAHKDAAHKPPKVVLVEPRLKLHRDVYSGSFQAVREVQVELQKDIIGHAERQAAIRWSKDLDARITQTRTDLENLKTECLNYLPQI